MAVDIEEHAMAFNIDSLVYEAMNATCSGEYYLSHITVNGNDSFDLARVELLALLLQDASLNWPLATLLSTILSFDVQQSLG